MSRWFRIITPVLLLMFFAVQGVAADQEEDARAIVELKQEVQTVLANQEKIVATLNEIKAQLRIIKVRVTQRS